MPQASKEFVYDSTKLSASTPRCYANNENVVHLGDELENPAHLLQISLNPRVSPLSHSLTILLLPIFQRDIVRNICGFLVRLLKTLGCPESLQHCPTPGGSPSLCAGSLPGGTGVAHS